MCKMHISDTIKDRELKNERVGKTGELKRELQESKEDPLKHE